MERGKRCKTISNDDVSLPEAMIQLIQSFLSGKEAARSTLLSKSWHGAWLTRPAIDVDQGNFGNQHPNSSQTLDNMFVEFATKTMQRYQALNMRIENFRLRTTSCIDDIQNLATGLVLNALNLGATNMNLELRATAFAVPAELLEAKRLDTLSLSGCEINGDVSWSGLKSLSLDKVHVKTDAAIRDIISRYILIQNLSISSCTSLVTDGMSSALSKRLILSRMSSCPLRRLKSLYLEMVELDAQFFKCLSYSFPYLADLSIVHCHGYTKIKIDSRSLERISFVQLKVMTAEFDVPNIRVFSYVGKGLPILEVKASESRQWESSISLAWSRSQTSLFFRRLKHMLMKFSESKITLSLKLSPGVYWKVADDEDPVIPQPPTIPISIEKLVISEASDACSDLLVRLFKVVRPKFISHCWVHASSITGKSSDQTLNYLCRAMMKESLGPNCFIPDQELFGKFELEQANAQISEQKPSEWPVLKKPLDAASTTQVVNKKVICFKLRWGSPQFN